MFNIVPLILILMSLGAIIIIVVRKFSVLANLDIETIQAEREAKFKERIISNRLKRNYFKYYSKVTRVADPLGKAIINFFKWLYNKLIEIKDNYGQEKLTALESQDAIQQKLSEADELAKNEKYDEAENKYIEIIGLESKNIKAWRSLGRVYFEKKNFGEAKQTLEHVIKLLEKEVDEGSVNTGKETKGEEGGIEELNCQLATFYYDLAIVQKSIEQPDDALRAIKKALKIEPNNPKYLDIMFEISIINKDKINALEAYGKMLEVNPDNQKLSELKKKVDEL